MVKSKLSIAARGLAFVFTLAAALLMGTNTQTIVVVDHSFTARFTDWGSFRVFVIVNSIACVVHFLAVWIPSGTPLWRSFIAVDMLTCALLIASWGSALTCFEVLKYGSRHVGWSPICRALPGFCTKAVGAMITGFIGFFIGFIFCCYDIHYLSNPLLLPAS